MTTPNKQSTSTFSESDIKKSSKLFKLFINILFSLDSTEIANRKITATQFTNRNIANKIKEQRTFVFYIQIQTETKFKNAHVQ